MSILIICCNLYVANHCVKMHKVIILVGNWIVVNSPKPETNNLGVGNQKDSISFFCHELQWTSCNRLSEWKCFLLVGDHSHEYNMVNVEGRKTKDHIAMAKDHNVVAKNKATNTQNILTLIYVALVYMLLAMCLVIYFIQCDLCTPYLSPSS